MNSKCKWIFSEERGCLKTGCGVYHWYPCDTCPYCKLNTEINMHGFDFRKLKFRAITIEKL